MAARPVLGSATRLLVRSAPRCAAAAPSVRLAAGTAARPAPFAARPGVVVQPARARFYSAGGEGQDLPDSRIWKYDEVEKQLGDKDGKDKVVFVGEFTLLFSSSPL